jgi:hypothetical protein
MVAPSSPPETAEVGRPPTALLVLAGQALFVAALYAPSAGIGLLSDAYYVLGHVSRGLLHSLSWDGSYHYYPVANAFWAVLWKLFGLSALGYQVVSLAQFVGNGWLLYLFGRWLLGDWRVALLGSLLFLGSSAAYEVTCWPVNGNLHNLAATFYLLALGLLWGGVRSSRPALWGWLFGLVTALAVFTYEPTVTLAAVGACQVALLAAADAGEPVRRWLRRRASLLLLVRLVGPGVLAVLAGLLVRAGFVLAGMQATAAPADYPFQLFLLVRAVLAIFTLTGADPLLYRFYSLGIPNAWGTEVSRGLLWAWTAAMAGLALAALWRDRRPAVRGLVAWFSVHLVLLHLVTAVVSRHFLIPAIPGSLLLALALWHGARRAAARLPRRGRRPFAGGTRAALVWTIAAAAVAALLVHSAIYVRRAVDVHLEATAATRAVREAIAAGRQRRPQARRLLLLNMDAILSRGGLGAFTFDNGLAQMVEFHFPGEFARVELGFTEEAEPGGHWANGSAAIGRRELSRRLADRRWIVVRFERASRRAALVVRPLPRAPVRGRSGPSQ